MPTANMECLIRTSGTSVALMPIEARLPLRIYGGGVSEDLTAKRIDEEEIVPVVLEWILNRVLPDTEESSIPVRLTDPSYGQEDLNINLNAAGKSALPIEKIWEITKDLPSLTGILSQERNNE